MANITSDQKLQFRIFNAGATGWENWAISGATGQIGFNEGSNKIKVNGIEYGLSPTETLALQNAVTTLYNNGLLATGGSSVTWLSYPEGIGTSGTAPISSILSALKTYIDTENAEQFDQYKTAIYSASLTGISGTNLFTKGEGNFPGITGHIDGADIAVGVSTAQGATNTYTSVSVAQAIDDIDRRIDALDDAADITLWHNGVEITGETVKADGTDYILKQGETGIATFNIVKDSFLNDAKLVWGSTSGEITDPDSQINPTQTGAFIYPVLYLDMIEREDEDTTDNTDASDIYIPVTSLFHDSTGSTGAQITVSVTGATSGAGNVISATINDYSLATSHLATSAYNELTNDVHSVAITGAKVSGKDASDGTTVTDDETGKAVTGVVSVTINGATVKTTTEITGATSIASGTTIEGALQAIDTELGNIKTAATGFVSNWGTVTGAASYSTSAATDGKSVLLNIDVEGTSVNVASGPSTGGVIEKTTATYDSSSSVAEAIDQVQLGAKQYADSLITWEVISAS